uniref:Biogenesis of lysosome-related organelles complex 1 subunit 1 n=1 Tax=Oryctolagus cuniculus TaxID=9986 RepID=A0A5F9D169_RABIT
MSPGTAGAEAHSSSRSRWGFGVPCPQPDATMLSRLLKEHQAKQNERKELQEKRRREAITAATCLTEALVDHLNVGVAQAYVNQRKLDREVKTLQAQAAQFAKQTGQWIGMVENFNQALKVGLAPFITSPFWAPTVCLPQGLGRKWSWSQKPHLWPQCVNSQRKESHWWVQGVGEKHPQPGSRACPPTCFPFPGNRGCGELGSEH